jgi:hypothetical protein
VEVEELIGSKVWVRTDQFGSVPGAIESMSYVLNLDDVKSSSTQGMFRIGMASGDVIESSLLLLVEAVVDTLLTHWRRTVAGYERYLAKQGDRWARR